jgi:VIT1/CCC1 family predicted Fe2+/Mn2+ transporter
LKKDQQNEITASAVYTKVAHMMKDEHNAQVLKNIAKDELSHYVRLKKITGLEMKPERFKAFFFVFISRVFGITFGLKLLERDEDNAVNIDYKGIEEYVPGIIDIIEQEEVHEKLLLEMIHEEKLNYIGSIVLGLNDALVELTGTLAGLSFAFQNTKIIALSGLITGIAASFSMAASEYLSSKADGEAEPLKSSIYTGIAYIATVILLVIPYFIFSNYLVCLVGTLIISILIIILFNYYVSVAKDLPFKKRFFEMAGISLSVALFSFGVGVVIRLVFGVDL